MCCVVPITTQFPILAMQIFGKMATGETITLDFRALDTNDDVKATIQNKEGISPDRPLLVFARMLSEGGRTLSGYIQKDTTLCLVLCLHGGLQISVKTLTSKTITFGVRASNSTGRVTWVCGYGGIEIDPICARQACMEGCQVVTMDSGGGEIDIFPSATGFFDIINLKHIEKLKNHAIIGNTGPLSNESVMAGLEKFEVIKVQNISLHLLLEGIICATDAMIGGKHALACAYGDVVKESTFALQAAGARVLLTKIDLICASRRAWKEARLSP